MRERFPKQNPSDRLAKGRKLADEYEKLLERAGIKDQIKREERIFEPDYFEDQHLPPLFTQARRDAIKAVTGSKKAVVKNATRRIVFALSDDSLRKEIIIAQRKLSAFVLDGIQHDFWRAIRDRNEAGHMTISHILSLSVIGATIVLGAWSRGNAKWGVTAAVFVIIIAVYDAFDRMCSMRRSVEIATEEITALEADIEAHLKTEIFDQYEEDTGKEFKS